MAVQSLGASFFEGKLALSWDVMTETKSLLVNVAKDAEFTNSSRQFLIPPSTSSLHLDCGMGTWYVRIGALIGDDSAGMVDWSGIQGPVVVVSTKGNPDEPPCSLSLLHTQAIQEGVRLHTGSMIQMYALLEYSREPTFPSSATKTKYMLDWGRGYYDCLGLDPLHTYSIRIRTWGTNTKDASEGTTFAVKEVKPLSKAVVANGKQSLKMGKPTSGGDLSATRAGNRVVVEARERGGMRFEKHSDYVKYLAAKAKTSEGKRAV